MNGERYENYTGMIRERYGNDGGKVSFFQEISVFSDRFFRNFATNFGELTKFNGGGKYHLSF